MNKIKWDGHSISYEGDSTYYVNGHVLLEGPRWGWGLSTHSEGRNEPSMIEEGDEATERDAKLACDCAWVRYKQKQGTGKQGPVCGYCKGEGSTITTVNVIGPGWGIEKIICEACNGTGKPGPLGKGEV